MYYSFKNTQITKNVDFDIPKNTILDNLQNNKIITFGTCFAANLNKILSLYGVRTWTNTTNCRHYNPVSLLNMLEIIDDDNLTRSKDELYFHKDKIGGVHPYQYHFRNRVLTENSIQSAFDRMNKLDASLKSKIKDCTHVIISTGTNRVLRYSKNDVATCRVSGMKLEDFYSYDLSVDEFTEYLILIVEKIRKIRSGSMPNIVFTISPLRYNFNPEINGVENIPWIMDNNLSKSIQRVALNNVEKHFKKDPVYYFPSYEIVIDELRNFESLNNYDHLHINKIHTPLYVIKRFLESCATNNFHQQILLVDELNNLKSNLKSLEDDGVDTSTSYYNGQLNEFVDKVIKTNRENDWNIKIIIELYKIKNIKNIKNLSSEIDNQYYKFIKKYVGEKVYIWGTSNYYNKFYKEFIKFYSNKIELSGFIDSDISKKDLRINGIRVYHPSEINIPHDHCVIIASSFVDSVVKDLKKLNHSSRYFHLNQF